MNTVNPRVTTNNNNTKDMATKPVEEKNCIFKMIN